MVSQDIYMKDIIALENYSQQELYLDYMKSKDNFVDLLTEGESWLKRWQRE